ncbi:MAG: GDSL-type esterase/lipase family protein [Pirellulales bacterium]
MRHTNSVAVTSRLLLACLLGVAASFTFAQEDDRPVEDASRFKLARVPKASLPTLFLVGDSTVKCGTKGQRGWGEEIGKYFEPAKVNVVNHAIGGRSSRTFITEGRWAASLAMMREGDVVIIQFGHNDGGPVNDDSRARGSLRGVGPETEAIDNLLTKQPEVVRTYGAYLRQYLDDARGKGVTPYLCTQVPRKHWDQKTGTITRPTNGTVVWAREVAEGERATLLDLYENVATAYDELGPAGIDPLFADAATHTTAAGADFTARRVVALLANLPESPWPPLLSEAGTTAWKTSGGQPE